MTSRHRFLAVLLLLASPTLLSPSADSDTPTTLVYPSFLHTMGIRKATKTHLMIYTRNKVKVRDPQGIAVARLESWDDPDETKDDDEVTGYGVNSGENAIVYNKSMQSLGFYGLNETGRQALNRPQGVAANAKGDVYVADTGNHRIVRLYNPNRKLKFVKGIGGKGALPGQFNAPHDVEMDAYGMVYVTDTGNHRIQVLRPDDKLHHWFGDQGVEDGQLWRPTGIAVTNGKEKWSYYKDAFVGVIDLDGTRLQKFSLDGEFQKAIRLKDFGYKSGKMMYAVIDYYSQVWVTDFENHCIHKFDRDLNYLTSFGKKGTGDREFMQPRGLALYKRFGQIFVAEKESAQYYWIGTDVLDVAAEWRADKGVIALQFFLTEPSFVTLTLKSKEEASGKVLFEKSRYLSGPRTIYLDGDWERVHEDELKKGQKTTSNELTEIRHIPAGNYEFVIKIEATYSSYQHFAKEVRGSVEVEE